jgi:hypothetical protein
MQHELEFLEGSWDLGTSKEEKSIIKGRVIKTSKELYN